MAGAGLVSVVHLETGRHLYGGALQVLYLAQGLQERGVSSVLMVPKGSEVAVAARARWLRVEEFSFHGEGDLVSLGKLAWRFSRPDVELVHLHSRRGADTLGAVAATLARAPVIMTRRVDNPELPWIVGAKYGLYRRVVAISDAVREVLVEQGVPRDKISLVHSAVDASDWLAPRDTAARDREFDLEAGEPAGAMVAQFIQRKGHWVLIDALTILKGRGLTPKVVLFGRGPMERNVAALAEVAGVSDQIRFAGFRDDLHKWLGAFDFCVHPALREGLGVAALQAAAAGVPVVGARAGGSPRSSRTARRACSVRRATRGPWPPGSRASWRTAKRRGPWGHGPAPGSRPVSPWTRWWTGISMSTARSSGRGGMAERAPFGRTQHLPVA